MSSQPRSSISCLTFLGLWAEREVIHHYDLSCTQAWHQHLLHVGLKYPGSGRPFYGQRWPYPTAGHARKQSSVLPAVARHRQIQALTSWSIAVDWRQGGVRAALVHKHQPLGDDLLSHHHLPGRPLELVTLCGNSPPFFLVEPILAMARHMVERLTASPVIASM